MSLPTLNRALLLAFAAIAPALLPERLTASACADDSSLRLNAAAAYSNDPPAATTPAPGGSAELPVGAGGDPFGKPGTWFLTLGGGAAFDFDDATDLNGFVGLSTFVVPELELQLELGTWYFHQPGEDTGGVSLSIIGRWHFWHAEDFDWSVYGDLGIGVLGAFDDVPTGGTEVNFLPRAGVGFTKRLTDSGTRLQLGVRWHHISNARIRGESDNPVRNGVMLYAGVVFPL